MTEKIESIDLSAYERVSGGDVAEKWNPEDLPTLAGIVSFKGYYQAPQDDGSTKDIPSLVVEEAETKHRYQVTVSYMLKKFFDKVEEGQNVLIVYKGEREVGRPSKMKVFEAYCGKS